MNDRGLQRLGKYDILEKIGAGAFADVYKARDTILERTVALKIPAPFLLRDPGFIDRFQREARAAANLKHPNIVTTYDMSEIEGVYYIAMEYLPGRTLRDIIKEEGALPLDRTLDITEQVAGALDYAHAQGLAHRDVKPSNIIIDAEGHATLTDFGLVKAMAEATLTSKGAIVGTPEYMSPEQAEGKPTDKRSDIYSLGIVVYQMLTGQVPFSADSTPATLYAQVHTPPPPPSELVPDLPRGIEVALLKALAKAPEDRYQTAGSFADALEAAVASHGAKQDGGRLEGEKPKRKTGEDVQALYNEAAHLLANQDYEAALAKLEEVKALDSEYGDPHAIERTARRQLRRRRKPRRERQAMAKTVWKPALLLMSIGVCVILASFALAVAAGISWLSFPSPQSTAVVTRTLTFTPTTSTPSVGTAPAGSPTAALSANEYVTAGDELFNDGRYEEAVAQYEMALGVEPQNGEIYSRLGQAYVQMDSCDRAVPEFQQALALDPELESAQAGLIECGGSLPPGISFSTYSRSDLSFALLYPSTWFVREEELQTIFAENEGDIDSLRGNVFFISSLPLTAEEEGMDSMGALIKARQLIDLPMGSQLGGVEVASFAGCEWATVRGQISGLESPTTIYIASTVKDANWYGIWAIAPSETWKPVSWPIFRVMANSAQLGQVVTEISPRAAVTQPSVLTGKIAYPRYVGGQTHYEIHIADINGNDLTVISSASEPALDLPGNRIVYRSWDSNFRGMVISGVGGGGRERPRGGAEPIADSSARWSPDGLSLVYATKRFGPHHNSLIRTHALAVHSELELGLGDTPDWSNDGQRIVVKANNLVIMDRTGGNVRQLTSNPSDLWPDWSPAGSQIAFTRDTGGNWDIWVINADGSGETRLTTDGSVDGLPAWNPEGTHIAFLSDRGGTWAIWVMGADGSGQRKLFNTGSATYATSELFDGEWSGGDSNSRRSWMDEQISWSW